jgi:hypothetical protein
MAKRPKRFASGEEVYSDYGSDEGRGAAGTSEIITKSESNRGSAGTSEIVKPKAAPTPKAESKPAPEPSSVRRLSREEGEAIRKASEASKPAPAKTESTSTPVAAKKETYRDFSGNIQTKKSPADKGESIGTFFSKMLKNREERLKRDKEQYGFSKGGTASSRADGIAQRGKTRGTMAAMCGGGMAKGKR